MANTTKTGKSNSEAASTDNPVVTDYDIYLFNEGKNFRIYEKFGAHPTVMDGVEGTYFAVWAPNAENVSVIGDFNSWDAAKNKMSVIAQSGVWTTFIPDLKAGAIYKYLIKSNGGTFNAEKTDPYGFGSELRPKTASVICDLNDYKWNDHEWMKKRERANAHDAPISIYEVHLGSWMRIPEEEDRMLTYRELAEKLTEYVVKLGYTHVEFLPVAEHPLDASWGYQITGYFAPTSRFGTPQDFMYLVDKLHEAGIGVILDWVPAHFPRDGHGLGMFDGTHLYEHSDPRQGEHKEWGTYVFNFGRFEVSNFLISNAVFWFDKYHIDGLRVDAVASMLYLDYARKDGEWVANDYGGRESIEAINFLRKLNETIYGEFPYAVMSAEESTAWPLITRPTYVGGLGFGYKWDMGWMHDTLQYMSRDPIYRVFHHDKLTFRGLYAFSENFVLPFSHDEVVHGKCSMLSKMPGDVWQMFANLRLLYGYMYSMTGKKLMFMGGEFGQWHEWYYARSLDWHLTQYAPHQGLQRWVTDLNKSYREIGALHEWDCNPHGFEWIDCQDYHNSVLAYMRRGPRADDVVVIVCNFTPVPRYNYHIGVPMGGYWTEMLNSDAAAYGGSSVGNYGGKWANDWPHHARSHSLTLDLPPLGCLYLRPKRD